MELDGKPAALITGSAKRLGKAIAINLAQHGFDIILHYRNSEKEAEETARKIRSMGCECETLMGDLEDSKMVKKMIPAALKSFPSLSLLVNNASVFERVSLLQASTDHYDRTMTVNLKAPVLLSRDFARYVGKGHIVNILDTKAMRTHSVYFSYTLSKKALLEFTRMAAVELGPEVRVNAVGPGLILPPEGKDNDYLKRLGQKVPLKRHGEPRDISRAVLFLVENTFITGECIHVDGGEHL